MQFIGGWVRAGLGNEPIKLEYGRKFNLNFLPYSSFSPILLKSTESLALGLTIKEPTIVQEKVNVMSDISSVRNLLLDTDSYKVISHAKLIKKLLL